MNYVEVEIGGKKRGFRFGLGCLGEMLEDLKIGVEDLDAFITRNPIKGIPTMLYHGARYEVMRSGDPVDFTIYDVYDWIDELPGEFNNEKVSLLIETFTKSLSKDVPVMEGSGEPKKK